MATILVTNDDGILAEGIWALAEELSQIGTVYVVAPDRERSAIGHAVTMSRPLRIKRYGENAFMVDGTPADCVKLALETILPKKPDLIASGINNGPNLGTDIFYSGTVSGAMEGAFYGVPAMAVSLAESYSKEAYRTAASEGLWVAKTILVRGLNPETILNVNVPFPAKKRALTTLAPRLYSKAFEERKDPFGRHYYWMAGEVIANAEPDEADVSAVSKKITSITPVNFSLDRISDRDPYKSWPLK